MLELLSFLAAAVEAVLSVFEVIGLLLDGLKVGMWVAEKTKTFGRWVADGPR